MFLSNNNDERLKNINKTVGYWRTQCTDYTTECGTTKPERENEKHNMQFTKNAQNIKYSKFLADLYYSQG